MTCGYRIASIIGITIVCQLQVIADRWADASRPSIFLSVGESGQGASRRRARRMTRAITGS